MATLWNDYPQIVLNGWRMDVVDEIRAFVATAKTGSFTTAAAQLGVSNRLTSKYVAELESRLGVRLLQRTTRKVGLTPAGEDLLADQPVVDHVESELEHPLGRGALGVDGLGPLQCHGLQVGVVHDLVDHAHGVCLLGGVPAPQEEDLPGELLAHLAGQVRRPEATVEAAHVGIGLLEDGVLGAGQGQVADHVQAVPAARGPARRNWRPTGLR